MCCYFRPVLCCELFPPVYKTDVSNACCTLGVDYSGVCSSPELLADPPPPPPPPSEPPPL